MKFPEYAEARGVDVEEVKEVLAGLGGRVHPNDNLKDEQVASLDDHFGVSKQGGGAALDVPSDDELSVAEEQESPVSVAPEPQAAPQQAQAAAAAPAGPKVYGEPGEGKHLFDVDSRGGKEGKYRGVYRAWGYDETTAIAEVVAANPQMKRVHSGINFRAVRVNR